MIAIFFGKSGYAAMFVLDYCRILNCRMLVEYWTLIFVWESCEIWRNLIIFEYFKDSSEFNFTWLFEITKECERWIFHNLTQA